MNLKDRHGDPLVECIVAGVSGVDVAQPCTASGSSVAATVMRSTRRLVWMVLVVVVIASNHSGNLGCARLELAFVCVKKLKLLLIVLLLRD